jgi:central kinetochore subunit Mal2/MCM21
MPRQADPREREDETGDGSEVLKPIKAKRQDLSEFVRHLRRELTAWHLRRDSIAWLRERIGIADEGDEELEGRETNDSSILSLAPTSIEARYARLEWRDGRVGRFKLSNSGRVERAVVIGDQGRDKRAEEILTGGDGRVESLPGRLSTIS